MSESKVITMYDFNVIPAYSTIACSIDLPIVFKVSNTPIADNKHIKPGDQILDLQNQIIYNVLGYFESHLAIIPRDAGVIAAVEKGTKYLWLPHNDVKYQTKNEQY